MVLMGYMCLFSGCLPAQSTTENLLKAPEPVEEVAELKATVKRIFGDNIVFRYPKSGEYKSPFISYDINADGKKEVIVFCSDKDSEETSVKILSKDKTDKKWIEIFSEIAPGTDVKKVLFLDKSDTNKFPYMIVNWFDHNKVDNFLTIYTYENKKIRCIYNLDYLTDVLLFDINNDKKNEIIVVDKTLKITPNIVILKTTKDSVELEKKSYVRLMPGLAECKKVTPGKLSHNNNALFLDEEKVNVRDDETFWCTEIIVAAQRFASNNENNEDDLLFNLSYQPGENNEKSSYLVSQSIRPKGIFCRDINKDSIIEIPRKFKYRFKYRPQKNEKQKSLTAWQRYFDGTFELTNLSVENVEDGYRFVFPDSWLSKDQNSFESSESVQPLVAVYYNNLNKELIFRNNDDSLDEIMRIRLEDESKQCPKDYDKILSKNNCFYCVKINDRNKKFNITLENVKKYFLFNNF